MDTINKERLSDACIALKKAIDASYTVKAKRVEVYKKSSTLLVVKNREYV